MQKFGVDFLTEKSIFKEKSDHDCKKISPEKLFPYQCLWETAEPFAVNS
jgi:hypothetical protein